MDTAAKIKKIREMMKKDGVEVYIVTSSDYHGSEYTGEYFETRKYLSGFTGSAGTLVVCENKAALYTDGRYFIQADRELAGSKIELMKMGMPQTPSIETYISENLHKGGLLACDTRTISAKEGIGYEKLLSDIGASGILFRDYAGLIWQDRPSLSKEKAYELEEKYSGQKRAEKLETVRNAIKAAGAQCHILTALDDIAWLLNIRGNDILYNPMVLSYFYMDENQGILFADRDKFDEKLCQSLAQDGISLREYGEFEEFISSIRDKAVLYDLKKINYSIYSSLDASVNAIARTNPEIMLKAVKNPVECENERQAHIKDGVCVTKFIYWLKREVNKGGLDEVKAADYLEELRKKQAGYIEPSFTTISAYNANAAMMHYNPYAGVPSPLKPEGILLVDSGGQYLEGTTDITRTISLGEAELQVKTHYTMVLRGMLNLANAKFLKGCTGRNLDILARGPLWENGLDYRCSTGHGVGYMLGVHEAPNCFRWKKSAQSDDECVLEPGMITTDEPGVYVEGSHGIRIENELLCVRGESGEYGDFLEFETLTLAPVDMELVNLDEMSEKELKLLRQYQKKVYDTLEKYLDCDEKLWLHKVCCEF
jgi:Xaa-Pro aminopeptidase